MGFWESVGIATPEDDDGNHERGRYLPTAEIAVTVGRCDACGAPEIVLGNGLCVGCWDFVVENSSADAREWPTLLQHYHLN